MRKFFLLFFAGLVLFSVGGRAESQDACAIWLCLPGGFPQGCEGAYSEFKHRLKKGRSPLPNLSSCTTGPNGEKSNGRYQLGYEKYYPCDEGLELKVNADPEGSDWARCVSDSQEPPCLYQEGLQIANSGDQCYYYYAAKQRSKPNYVKMWVNGEYLGQYFW